MAIIAEVQSTRILIAEVQDALDLMADCYYEGTDKIIIYQKNITPEFFDLKTGLADEILQKFSTYEQKLAIVGDFSEFSDPDLRDFIRESNRYGQINFVNSVEKAIEKLSK